MCLQCSTQATLVKENVLPGFSLMQATIDAPGWPAGHYGLVHVNDPLVVFPGPLLVDPAKGMDEDELDAMPEWPEGCDEYMEAAQQLNQLLNFNALEGYKLVYACTQVGYLPASDGLLGFWLLDHLATSVQADEPSTAANQGN